MTRYAGRAVLAASIANRPGRPGHAEAMLQWVLGLRLLGWQVTVLDRLDAAMCVDVQGRPCGVAESVNLRWLDGVMREAGLDGSWALLTGDAEPLGLGTVALRERLGGAVLFDVMGFLGAHSLAELADRRVFVDIDPGYSQMWQQLGLVDLLAGHERFVTVALDAASPSCGVPSCGVQWAAAPPPVVLSRWPFAPPPRDRGAPITTVGSWRGPWGVLECDGVRLGQRVHSFRPLLDLPARTGARFEVALEVEGGDAADRARLEGAGWMVLDPLASLTTRREYQSFLVGSCAELSVAKEMYVRTHSGWFSDRSACYLATGRPVVALQTGFSGHLPTGEGLLAFDSLDEAAEAVAAVRGDVARHARAARAIAEEHLDARRVLRRVLDEVCA